MVTTSRGVRGGVREGAGVGSHPYLVTTLFSAVYKVYSPVTVEAEYLGFKKPKVVCFISKIYVVQCFSLIVIWRWDQIAGPKTSCSSFSLWRRINDLFQTLELSHC